MKPPVFDYVRPATIAEALALLEENSEGAVFLAGGQSLMPALNFRLAAPQLLIDLNAIASLSGVQVDDQERIVAGAMTRHRFFETSAMIAERLPLLRHAMASLAHVAVRNRGTIGGSLCHADPSAEWPALCLACDAEMMLQGRGGTRRVKADEFSLGLFSTALEPGELLAQIVFPPWPRARRWGFQEVSRRRGDFAIVGVACVVDLDECDTCLGARIVVFGATDRPTLQPVAASELIGRKPGEDDVQRAARATRAAVACRSDHHASAEYRSQLVQALTTRALAQALSQA